MLTARNRQAVNSFFGNIFVAIFIPSVRECSGFFIRAQQQVEQDQSELFVSRKAWLGPAGACCSWQDTPRDDAELGTCFRSTSQCPLEVAWLATRAYCKRSRSMAGGSCGATGTRSGYCFAMRVSCDATTFQRPWRLTKTSVQIQCPLMSLPLYELFSSSLQVTTAVSPKTRTFMSPSVEESTL